jgi:hypothetical protein
MQQFGAEAQQRLSQLANQLKQDQAELAELADGRGGLDEESLAEGRQAVAAVIQAVENLEITLPKD